MYNLVLFGSDDLFSIVFTELCCNNSNYFSRYRGLNAYTISCPKLLLMCRQPIPFSKDLYIVVDKQDSSPTNWSERCLLEEESDLYQKEMVEESKTIGGRMRKILHLDQQKHLFNKNKKIS